MPIVKAKRSFRREFRRQLRFAITAAIGFTVAYAWRNAIYDALYDFVQRFSDNTQTLLTDVYTAMFITFLGVILISITARLLKEKNG